jgi:hypothetical protein
MRIAQPGPLQAKGPKATRATCQPSLAVQILVVDEGQGRSFGKRTLELERDCYFTFQQWRLKVRHHPDGGPDIGSSGGIHHVFSIVHFGPALAVMRIAFITFPTAAAPIGPQHVVQTHKSAETNKAYCTCEMSRSHVHTYIHTTMPHFSETVRAKCASYSW